MQARARAAASWLLAGLLLASCGLLAGLLIMAHPAAWVGP